LRHDGGGGLRHSPGRSPVKSEGRKKRVEFGAVVAPNLAEPATPPQQYPGREPFERNQRRLVGVTV
jgi:hypothetical protein